MKAWQYFGILSAVFVAPTLPPVGGVVIGAVCTAVMLATAIWGDK